MTIVDNCYSPLPIWAGIRDQRRGEHDAGDPLTLVVIVAAVAETDAKQGNETLISRHNDKEKATVMQLYSVAKKENHPRHTSTRNSKSIELIASFAVAEGEIIKE